MEQANPFTGLLNRLLDTAGEIVPSVIGKKDNASVELRNVAGTAEPVATKAAAMPKWIGWAIGGAAAIGLVIVLVLFARRS